MASLARQYNGAQVSLQSAAQPMSDVPLPKIRIESIASNAATCEEIVLRQGDRIRLVLRAMIVDSTKEPAAGVHARLLYQRKKQDTQWEDVPTDGLNKLKADDSVAIDLKAEEVLRLRHWLNDLQSLKDAFGVPKGDTYFIGVTREVNFFGNFQSVSRVLLPNGTSSDEFSAALKALFERPDVDTVLSAALNLPPERIAQLGNQLGASALDQLLDEWAAISSTASEEEWQRLFARHAFALQQVFHTPAIVINQKAYVGGKDVTNASGSIADFLLATESTGLSLLVEIKTPSTPLLVQTSPYRNRVWNSSSELSGSILQVLTYRASLIESMPLIGDDRQLRAGAPKCAVIIGNSATLNSDDKKRSFELARGRSDVTVLTFDELQRRLEGIKAALATIRPGSVNPRG